MKAETIAKFFLNKDNNHLLFSDELKEINNHKSFIGNIRLNKYLHIAQNLYIAKFGKKLFEDNLYAFNNGGVVENVRKQYSRIKLTSKNIDEEIPNDIKNFLDKLYVMLNNATIDDLIQISHEDIEWLNKNNYRTKENQKMNNIEHINEYKKQYADALYVMDTIC